MCNLFLAFNGKEFSETGLRVDSSKREPQSRLNEILTSDAVLGMLAGKHYQCSIMVFPFICEYVPETTGYIEDTKLMEVRMIYLIMA